MVRIQSFDSINKAKLAILKALWEREFDAGEICMVLNANNRAKAYGHLKTLQKLALVGSKDCLKKNCDDRAKNSHRKVKRWFLTKDGEQALAYFCGEAYLK